MTADSSDEFRELLAGSGLKRRPYGALGYLASLIGFGFLVTFIALPFFVKSTHGELDGLILSDVTLGPVFVVWVLYGMHLGSLQRVVTLTAVEERSWFASSRFEISAIEWLRTNKRGDKNQFERTEICSGARRIAFWSHHPYYAELRDYLHSQVDPNAIEAGKTVIPIYQPLPGISHVSLRTGAYLMMIPLFLSMAVMRRVDAVDSQAYTRALDMRGATTTGYIVGNITGLRVDFAFNIAGQRLVRSCSVPRELAERLHNGDPVTLVYLPENARVCRIAGSDDHEAEAAEIRFADLFGAVGVITPLLFIRSFHRWFAKQAKLQQG